MGVYRAGETLICGRSGSGETLPSAIWTREGGLLQGRRAEPLPWRRVWRRGRHSSRPLCQGPLWDSKGAAGPFCRCFRVTCELDLHPGFIPRALLPKRQENALGFGEEASGNRMNTNQAGVGWGAPPLWSLWLLTGLAGTSSFPASVWAASVYMGTLLVSTLPLSVEQAWAWWLFYLQLHLSEEEGGEGLGSLSESGESRIPGAEGEKEAAWRELLLGGGVGGDADRTTDVATCVNSRITGANISQNSVAPVPSEKMILRPFILLFGNFIYFAWLSIRN